MTEYRLDTIEREQIALKNKMEELDKVYVRLERYVIVEKAVIAIFATLSLAAFGLVWQLTQTLGPVAQ